MSKSEMIQSRHCDVDEKKDRKSLEQTVDRQKAELLLITLLTAKVSLAHDPARWDAQISLCPYFYLQYLKVIRLSNK